MSSTTTCNECKELETLTAGERHESGTPTNWWHCGRCGRHINRHRGTSDQTCVCGAEYNAGGQRLRDNWRDNRSWDDDDVDDLEGYERACLAAESRTGG